MSERQRPFVAYATLDEDACGRELVTAHSQFFDAPGTHTVPVVVTPLLPDDPKPGETWIDGSGEERIILSAPYEIGGCREVMTARPHYNRGETWYGRTAVAWLRRPPVLKTFRLRAPQAMQQITVEAASREAALAKLAESLEEVG